MLPRHLLGLICPIEHGGTCTVLSRRHALDFTNESFLAVFKRLKGFLTCRLHLCTSKDHYALG